MLFVLDNDVDAAVGRVLRSAGHKCLTAPGSGLAEDSDDVISVFADDHSAVLLTHDIEFTARRRRNPYGRHVRLACQQWDAPAVVATHLDELISVLDTQDAIVVKVTKSRVRVWRGQWT